MEQRTNVCFFSNTCRLNFFQQTLESKAKNGAHFSKVYTYYIAKLASRKPSDLVQPKESQEMKLNDAKRERERGANSDRVKFSNICFNIIAKFIELSSPILLDIQGTRISLN